MKKKNTRIKHKKYDRRKKYIFPLIVLSILLGISVIGVFATADDHDFIADNIKYKITSKPSDASENGTVSIVGLADGAAIEGKLTIGDAVTHTTTSPSETTFTYNISTIESAAFKKSSNLTELDLSNASNLADIKIQAFSTCSNLTEVTLPSSLKTIGKAAFASCVNLKSVDFNNPAELTIGTSAFKDCPWLTELKDLPETKEGEASALSITDGAFWGCCYLNEDLFPEGTDPFGTDFVQNFTTELRGISINQIIPADGTGSTDKKLPDRRFKGQKYTVAFNQPAAGYSLTGLDFLDSISDIPNEYGIDEDEFPEAGNLAYSFTMPNSDTVILFAVATKDGKTSGAPTITTDKLTDGVKEQPYSFTLKADSEDVVWSVENKDGTTTLPAGLTLNPNGTITSDKIEAEAGEYEIGFVANNGISTHKKLLTLKIHDNSLPAFGENSLWWEESNDKISVAWTPVMTGSHETVHYYINIYDENGNQVGDTIDKPLPGNFSNFASEDVTEIIKKSGKGTYYFTITAESEGLGSSTASSSDSKYAKGIYAYGYEKHTITATASGTGTGKISITPESYQIPGIDVSAVGNTVKVDLIENSVSKEKPLTFIFTPDRGCEVTRLTVDGVEVTKEKERYVFTSIEKNTTGNSSSSGSSSDSSSESGTISGDSGVLPASNTSTTLNADSTGSNDHDILVEFGLVNNNIDGEIITKNTYIQKEKAAFEAIGDGMNDVPVVDGVTRWLPKYWWLDDEKLESTTTTHNWVKSPYTDAVDTTNLSLGTHTLYVAFQKQIYSGSAGQWVDSTSENSVDVRAVDFVVTDKSGNTVEPDSDDGSDKTGNDDEGAGTANDDNKDSDKKDDDKKADNKKDNASDDKPSGNKSSDDETSSGIGSAVDKVTSVLSGVDTSDDMVMGLWVALALASLIGIGFCIRQIIKFS